MVEQAKEAFSRGFRIALALLLTALLAVPVTGVAQGRAYAVEGDEALPAADGGTAQLAAAGDGAARAVEGFSFGVMSDPHYFPAEYQGTRAEAYQNQTSGDLRLMGENEALTTGAVDQMLADAESGAHKLPKVLLVTGDLTSEGEKAGHEGFAAQMKRLQEAGTTVLVIPGNHDLYNYDAMTFQSDEQVKDGGAGSLWTTEADFRSIYASMGLDEEATKAASNGTIESIDYFVEDLGEDGIADCQGGLSYVAKTTAGVAFIMIDSEVYTADWNGQGKAWGQGAGMMSDELLEWVKDQAAQLTEEGYSIVAGIHHPVLEHQATAETEFITDRVDVGNGDGTRSTDNSRFIATQLADAGIHYIFSGHMHENDIASYTTAAGNTIYDMETGGLCAYPAPYRYASLTTQDTGEMTLDLWSVGVKQAAMNQKLDAPNGTLTNTDKVDVSEYMKDAMYGDKNEDGESFITRLVMRYAARYLDQLADIPAALESIAGLDLYDTLFDALPGLLGGGTTVDLDSLGSIYISWNDTGEFNTSGVNLNPSGTAGLLSSFTIRNEDIKEEVQSVLDQIEANYIANGRLEQEISKLLESVGDVNLLNPDNPNDTSGNCYTLRQLLQDMFQRHNSGADKEPMPENMQQALENLQSSDILKNEVTHVLNGTLVPLIEEVLGSTTISVDNLFGRNTLWHTAVQALLGSDNPSIATVLDKFGLDLFGDGGLVTGLLDQYLTDSVYQQIGGLVVAMVTGFAGDADTLDDVVSGVAVQLNATMNPEPNPTVENGALPDQVSMSLDSESSATSRQFSWYTSTDVSDTDVQVIPASAASGAEEAAAKMDAGDSAVTSVEGTSEEVNKAKITLNLVLVTDYEIVKKNRHTATATVPAGDFYYRVGSSDDGYWSDPVYVDGEDNPADGYTALVVADSQGASEADYEAYEAVLAKAEEQTDGEAFALHLGDMVDDGVNENYWSWLMNTGASEAVATMPVAGNHEARQDDDQLANAIAAHYNVDIPDQDTSTGLYYSFVYGDATYIVLNTNDGDAAVGEAQKQWAASVADSADTTWKILVTHKAPYSKGSHQGDSDVVALRSWLSTFATQHDIDLVLSGHDHTYMRTPSLTNGTEATVTTQQVTDSAGNTYDAQVNPAGTTFVIPSTSGTKFYDIVENDLPTAEAGQPYQPIHSTLSIEGDTLFWRSYTYDAASGSSELYDSFAIKKDDNLTAAEKVMQMIDALPDPNAGSEAILAAEDAVNEARDAYDALTEEERAQVSNLAKLEQLEQLIVVYQDINGKETVDLSTGIYYDGQDDDEAQRRAAFKEAIANPNVGTIIFPGDYSTAIGEYSGNTLNNQYYEISHNLVIKAAEGGQGFADLRRCGFIVKDGATLVLEDVKLQAWQKKPLIGNTTPMNMIRVEDGTLIANGNTSVLVNRDDGSTDGFKDEGWRGHAIIVGNPDNSTATGERTVYLNTTGTISGLRDSVVQHEASSSENDHVYLNGGTYNTIYGGNSSVNLSCQLEINGGTFTKVTSYEDLVIGGGAFNGSSVDYPIWMGEGANLYVKNADSFTAGTSGKVFQLSGGSELHIANAALSKLSGVGLDLAAGDYQSDPKGFPLTATAMGLGEGQKGTIFAIGQQITSMPGMAANNQGGLDTTVNGAALSATADLHADQQAYAYAKYHAASNSALAAYVDGETGNLYAYSDYQLLANPLPNLQLSADQGPIVAADDEGAWPAVDMTATVDGDATKLITWQSSDEGVATVDGEGKVTFKKPGQVTITVTHVSTGASETMTFYAVEPALEGSEIFSADSAEGQPYELALGMGGVDLTTLPEGYTVEWSLSEGATAEVTPSASDPLRALLERKANQASTLTLTATLMKDGQPTGVTASKDISLEEVIAAPEYDVLAGLIDVKLADASDVGHGELTSGLLANTEGQQDSYTVSSTYRVDAPASNPVQMFTDFVGLTEPAKIWKVKVTVHAAPYVDAYNESEQAGGVEHALAEGEQADKTVTLVYDEAAGMWSLDTGSTSTIEYQVACETVQVGFAYVGAPEGTDVPEPVTIPAGATLGDKLPTPEVPEGYTFVGWFTDEACETPYENGVISEDATLYGQWGVEAGSLTPAAPTGQAVAKLEGISVALNGVNEINSDDSGDGSHPDVTFGSTGEGAEALIADSFTVGTPAQGADGTWTVEVTMDVQKYLDAYAKMGEPAYGPHYFASSDETGERTFELAYNEDEFAWKLADGQETAFAFDITCLTLQPAELVKYAGGAAGDDSHFPDARVIDGQGNVYAIDQLNALLDEGVTARVAYYDESGAELADDTEPGVYEARIVVEDEGASQAAQTRAGEGADETVNVNVNGTPYAFALEPSTLTIRNASDEAAAESGALGVELIGSDADASAIAAAVDGAAGGVAAQLPAGTKIYVNDREAGELTGEALSGIRLFSDDLLGAEDSGGVDRLQALKDRAAELGFQIGDNADFQYLDLVDANQANVWVSSSEGATIYWKVPKDADIDSLKVLHFKDLHREYGVNAEDLQDQIKACTVEQMPLDTITAEQGYVSFKVARAGFSPFVLTWDADEPEPVQKATVTFDANGGTLPEGAPESVKVTAGGTIASLPAASRTGYEFAGWTTADGAAFTTGTPVNADLTVTARWKPKQYTVAFDAQGGTIAGGDTTVAATYDAPLGALPTPTRDGYAFKGWFTQPQGGEQVTADTVYRTAGPSIYYARWELTAPAAVTLTLDAGEGTFVDGATATVKLPVGGALSAGDLPVPTRDGFALAGWYLDAQLADPVVFTEDADPAAGVEATVFNADATLYAKWLEDVGSDADISFAGIVVEYTGKGVAAAPTFGAGFPAAEQGEVQVLYRSGDEPWTDGAPVGVGSYDVKFVYEGSDAYAPFEKEYPAGIVIAPAKLAQTGLAADPAEVPAGTRLADVALAGATVTMADGTVVAGAWSWVDVAGVVNAAGAYQAVFTPADGAANYQPLYADVQVGVKAVDPGTGSGDPDGGSGDAGDGQGSGSGEDGSGDGTGSGQGGNQGAGGEGQGLPGGGSGSDAKLVATGDPLFGVFAGVGTILLVALGVCVVALRRSRR